MSAPAGGRSREAGRRWLHLVLGGALLMPFFLAASVIVDLIAPHVTTFNGSLLVQLLAYLLALPFVLAAGALLPVRGLTEAAARSLLGPPYADSPAADPEAPGARGRLAAFWFCHLALGGLVAGLCLAVVPFAVLLLGIPLYAHASALAGLPWVHAIPTGWAPPIGIALLVLLVVFSLAAGRLIGTFLAPRLLGPSVAEALAHERARAERLARRNRLARDLHDSVGHSLSVVLLQASAARRVLDRDPGFTRSALEAIENASREALAELDGVLGVLRAGEDDSGSGAALEDATPDLTSAEALVARTCEAGVRIEYVSSGSLEAVPLKASREAYRILQEGLNNAARHAGAGAAHVRVAVEADAVELEVVNPLPNAGARLRDDLDSIRRDLDPPQRRGGRGLIGIRERVTAAGGECSVGPAGDDWRLWVRLPLS